MSRTFKVVNGSAVMGADGQPEVLEGYDKTQQDINDVLLTPYDAQRDYGNELITKGPILIERLALPGLVRRDVSAAIGRLRRYQTFLPRDQLPSNEKIDKLKEVVTRPVGNLGIAFLAVVGVVDRSAEDVRTVFKISNEHLQR